MIVCPRPTGNWKGVVVNEAVSTPFTRVKPTELAATGYAEFHPVADNDTEEGRAKNRRVDIILLSHPAPFPGRYHRTNTEDKMPEFTLRIDNMHCGSCVRRVSQALASTGGLQVKEVRIGAARLSSTLNPAPVEQALAALAKAGYPAQLDE